MSLGDESKPQINSIANSLKLSLNIKSEDLGPVLPKRLIFKEFETKPRLLAPSKLSINECNERPNQLSLLSPSKRFSDEGEDSPNKELSPLFKRIKKENNNCLLFDSKQFIKQELDTELDFNSRQPFVNMFSKLTLDRTCMPAPESSNSYPLTTFSGLSEGNDLSEVLKQLNICHKSNQNCDQSASSSATSKLKKKKKNKKSKKPREKKIKLTRNVFKTVYNSKSKVKSMSLGHKKDHYLFKVQSSVIKELKVSANGGLSADEVQALMVLKNEGVVRKNRKHLLFKCLLCLNKFSDLKSAEDHIKSDSHVRNKSEQRFSRLDSLMALDWGQSNDIEILLSRRRLLNQLSNKTKEVLHSKGIRVKDGFGANAFVCIDCRNEAFESLEAVFDHINTKSRLLDGFNHISLGSNCDNIEDVFELKPDLKKLFADLSVSQLNERFDSEGIIKRVQKRSKSKKLKYFCTFCQKYRNTDYEMFKHINDLSHLSAKTRDAIKNQMTIQ